MFIFGCILVNQFGPNPLVYRIEDWQDPKNRYIPDGYDKSKWNVLFDSHFHTRYSDGLMTIEQGIHWHLACGFNAFVVTDHGTAENLPEILELQEKYKDKCIIIPGIELNSFNGHMNVVGIKEWDVEKFGWAHNEDEIIAIVNEAHRQGAVTTWNHYPWSYGGAKPRYTNEPTREQVLSLGIDFIESSNWDDDIDTIDKVSYDFCQAHKEIGCIVGTDVHRPEKDDLWAWTLINVSEFTPEALMEELRNKRTDVLFKPSSIPYPTQHQVNPKIRPLYPFHQIGEMFISLHRGASIENIDWGLGRIWISYLFSLFGIMEIVKYFFF